MPLGFGFLLAAALLANSLFDHPSRVSYLSGLFVIAYACLVMVSEAASLVRQINLPFYLVAHLVLILFFWILWRRAGKPALLGPFSGGRWAIWREFLPFWSAPALYLLAAGVGLTYFLGAVLILAFPQHNYDSMTYHLSRVGYWLQHGSLAPWPTPNARQTTFPINAELGLMWTILMWGSDQLTGFVQWFSALATMISIFGIARLLGANRQQGLFAALVWATFPEALLQTITTQNDLVVAAFVTSTVYLFYLGLSQQKKRLLLLSGLALGLSLGAKSTAVIFLPGLALAVLVAVWRRSKKGVSLVTAWLLMTALGFGLLGAFNYIQNYLYYGNPFSVPEWTDSIVNPQVSRKARLGSNVFLYLYQFADTTGIPERFASAVVDAKAEVAYAVIKAFHLPLNPTLPGGYYSLRKVLYPYLVIHPDTSWYGPLSVLLLLPAGLYHFWQGLRRRDDLRLGLILISAFFVFTLSLFLSWTPYKSRYFIPAVAVAAPLLAFLYQLSRRGKVLQWAISALALWIMGWTVLNNAYLPLVGVNAVWGLSQESIRLSGNPSFQPALDMVESSVPMNAVLATRLGENAWDYPLFGPKFERRIIQIDPRIRDLDLKGLQEKGATYLLISPAEHPFLVVPQGLEFLGEVKRWTLYKISLQSTSSGVPPEVAEKLLGLSDNRLFVSVDPKLAGVVGLAEIGRFDWDIETEQGRGFLWLGEGMAQGVAITLWSETELPVRIGFDLLPGPSRFDLLRNLEFRFYRLGAYGPIPQGALTRQFQIAGPGRFEVVVNLQRGSNQFRLFALDKAQIRQLPNGDERPLLVRIQHIDVLPTP